MVPFWKSRSRGQQPCSLTDNRYDLFTGNHRYCESRHESRVSNTRDSIISDSAQRRNPDDGRCPMILLFVDIHHCFAIRIYTKAVAPQIRRIVLLVMLAGRDPVRLCEALVCTGGFCMPIQECDAKLGIRHP